jgi:hypothetical protein
MRELTEQEQLARLVRSDDREPLDSASMLFDNLRSQLGDADPDKIAETKREIEASGNKIENKAIKKFATQKMPDGYSTEKVLMSLYDIRDSLIETFQSTGINSSSSKKVISSIEKVDVLIKTAGGEVDRFDPLDHCSGLQAPNFHKSAEKVIETTMQCYSLGKIDQANITDGGKIINIVFSGESGETAWKATGTIKTDEWTGNEAIDYVYTPREGHMSVKAYDNGRLIDKIACGKYKIHWDLEERAISKKQSATTENKEGKMEKPQNNIDNGEEEIGSPINS